MYIWQVIAFAGIFFGVEDSEYEGGGKRPPFISGGVQNSRIMNFTGRYMQGYSPGYVDTQGSNGSTGPFYPEPSTHDGTGQRGISGENYSSLKAGWGFDPSLVVPTGPDNAPVNAAVRFWRRTD
jgi:hypothetical protein